MSAPSQADPRLAAAVGLIGRTGATSISLRYSDDEQPVVWMALADYSGRVEVDAALDPLTAALRLAERLIDGGTCTHCKCPTGLVTGLDPTTMPTGVNGLLVCWYQWDPELATFRRGCEGDER